jgi:hypothetical protein
MLLLLLLFCYLLYLDVGECHYYSSSEKCVEKCPPNTEHDISKGECVELECSSRQKTNDGNFLWYIYMHVYVYLYI